MKRSLLLLLTACGSHREPETVPKQATPDQLYNKILAEALPTLAEALRAYHVSLEPVERAPQRAQYWFSENTEEFVTYEPTRTLNGFTLTLQGYTSRSLASRGNHQIYAIGHAIDTELFLQVNETGLFAYQQSDGSYTRRTADENTLTVKITKPIAKEQTYLLEGLDIGVARWLVPISDCKEGDAVVNFYNHDEPDFCQREAVLDERGELQLQVFYDAYRNFIDTQADPLYSCIETLNVSFSSPKQRELSYSEKVTRDAMFGAIDLQEVGRCYDFMDLAKKKSYDPSQIGFGSYNTESLDARLAECAVIVQPFEQKQQECRQLVDSYNKAR